MKQVSHGIDRIEVSFDEPTLVANAGLLAIATLTKRLGLESLVNATVNLAGRVGGALPGRKILTLVHAIVAGASHIDHADVLRSGASASVLSHRVMAPSTLGTFLRAFTFGHMRQLDKVIDTVIQRAWALGIGPRAERLVVDMDSTVCEVHGKLKQGAGYGYTKKLGYHPLLATRATTGELLHARMRKGAANTQRGVKRFVAELVARCRRAGASGEIVLRMDSGFWSKDTISLCERLDVRYVMAIRSNTPVVARAIEGIAEDCWVPIGYVESGEAEVAECTYGGHRLIVRRTRMLGPVAELFPDWRHFGFLTDVEGDAVTLDKFYRRHAVVELAIKDLKEGAGMEHVSSGHFSANGAWLACAVLAHNLVRWTAMLGGLSPKGELVVARTLRVRYFSVPGRLVNRAGRRTLRAPSGWPWAEQFTRAVDLLHALPPVPV